LPKGLRPSSRSAPSIQRIDTRGLFQVEVDSGATVDYTASLGGGPDGRSQHYAQLTVDGSFYQRDNRVTITADPNNEYSERVESDNSTVVLIPRQPRPANSMIDLNCQVA
jgi:hypothetical protein